MRNFTEVTKEEVMEKLREGKTIQAIVLEISNLPLKGEITKPTGVYPLKGNMAVLEVQKYIDHPDVIFFEENKKEEPKKEPKKEIPKKGK